MPCLVIFFSLKSKCRVAFFSFLKKKSQHTGNMSSPHDLDGGIIASGDLDAIREAISNGANVDPVDDYGGFSALMWAALSNQVDVMQILLDNGANLRYVNGENRTAICYAAKFGHMDAVQYLVSRYTDMTHIAIDIKPALPDIVLEGHSNVIQYLMNLGVEWPSSITVVKRR